MTVMIALAGKPNAGKSTFFKAATLADVEIANYPFTTIKPNLGVSYVRARCPSVELKLDNSVVSSYLYTDRELKALQRGGVQRLYMGNLKTGKHELVAVFTGKGPRWRDYRRGTTLKFDKGTDPKYIELQIRDETRGQQPEFRVKEW